jgi:transposase-like protein
MDNSENSYKCTVCEKKFTITILNAGYPGGKEREIINCPWCGAENGTVVTSGIITTYKVDTEDGAAQ